MTIAAGSKLGPYEVVAPLGAGGMGEVWRARDPRLSRDVAIKVLPPHLADTPDARARLEREAKAVAALNHPHICTLFDVGREGDTDYLVMELVEGETLAQRLQKGPLPTADVLRLGAQIADALDKAHRQGLIHRDLKPGNIMLTKSGAKLMDFGLARAVGAGAAPSQLSTAATMTTPLTAAGSIVGTFQYIAPEQLEGAEADARSDIFALGAVLYEMTTGQRAFEGKTQASLIASILGKEPAPASSVSPMTPPALDRLLQGCLAKDPEQRVQTAHDVKLQLTWIAEGGSQAGVPAPVALRRKGRERMAWIVAAIAGVAALTLGAVLLLRPAPEHREVRFTVRSEPGARNMAWPRLSPDGKLLLYLADDSSGVTRVWLRPVGSFTASPLAGTEGAYHPYWSPDSRSIAFAVGNQIKRLDVTGGPPQLVTKTQGAYDGAWGVGGVIVFDGTLSDSLRRVAADGGEVAPASRLDHKADEVYNAWPVFLPDGKHFLFLAGHRRSDELTLKLGVLGSLDSKAIGTVPTRVEYSPTGHVLYIQDGTLMARPIDIAAGRFTGGAFPVADRAWTRQEAGEFSVSSTGAIAFRLGTGGGLSELQWRDRAGNVLERIAPPDQYRDFQLSPDGTRLAYGLVDPSNGNQDIWVRDLKRGVATRATFDPVDEIWPTWSPDGNRLAYAAQIGGNYITLARNSDGTGAVDTLYRGRNHSGPSRWTPDGRAILINDFSHTGSSQVCTIPAAPGDSSTPVHLDRFGQTAAMLSPDGRWIAYSTNETGRAEVFVSAYPGPGGKYRVSNAGGFAPVWRGDGKELYYRDGEGGLYAVPVRAEGNGLDLGAPVRLFTFESFPNAPARNRFDAARDGQRFVVNAAAMQANQGVEIDVILGWQPEKQRR